MITQEFDLNLIPDSEPVIVHVNQYDTGIGRLVINLYNGIVPYEPTGTAVIQGTKPDGHGFMYNCTLSGGVVTADLKEQMSVCAGSVKCQIVVTETSGNTGTFVFDLEVQPSALPSDAEMSDSDYPIIEELIQDAQEAAASAATSEANASNSASDSEAWAVGTRGGDPVSPSDPTYHNNSKYWAEHGGGGGDAHTIIDADGNDMPQRGSLQFMSEVVDDALHDMTIVKDGGGSMIEITTSESTLFGEDVTLSDGVKTWTKTFDSTGHAYFTGITSTGTLTVESTDGEGTARGTLPIPYYGRYTKSIAFWSATIAVSTTTSQFDGLTVSAKLDGAVVASDVFSNNSATLAVHDIGTYTIEVAYQWATYTETVEVSAETTYPKAINGFFATVNLETPNSEFYSQPIRVKLGSNVISTVLAFDGSGDATFTALKAGTYEFGVQYDGDWYTTTLPVSAQTTYNDVVIKMFNAIISITTNTFADNTVVTISKGQAIVGTTTFVSGSASYTVHETGTFTVSATDSVYQYTYTDEVPVSAETTYPASLDIFNATLSLTTTSPELASSQITITKGGVTIGTTTFVSSSASFVVHETGTYTCSCTYLGDDYSTDVPVSTQTTYPVAIDTGLKLSAWLEAADLDPSDYADFSEVEADEEAVRKLMTIHAAVDYLATAKSGDELMTAVVTSNICAKWINLRDYALDTLYANTAIASAMDTADKYFYGEWVITDDTTTPVTWGPKGNVPIMTSATEPYGSTINKEGHTENAQWQAFDGNYSTASTSSGSPWDIGYLFMAPVCVKRVRIITRQNYASANVNVLQGSIDGTSWTNLDADLSVLSTADTEYVIPVNNSNFYLKYRIYCATSNYNGFRTLQFYGREKKPVLPAMLNNSTPVGSTSASTELSTQAASYPAWRTFSGFREETSAGSYWSSSGSPAWIQQTFPTPLKLNEMWMRNNGYGNGASGIVDAFSVQGLNASTNEWDTLYSGTNEGGNISNAVSVYTLNAPGKYTAIKINCTSNHGDSQGRVNIGRIQFFAYDYSEYEWDSTDPKYMLYDHGVEIQPITTGGTKKDSYITLTANNQTALATVDTTNYTIMGGVEGSHASGSQQLTCGSATSNFNNANRPRSNWLNITNVNGSNSVGFKMTANGTADIEEIWIGGSV